MSMKNKGCHEVMDFDSESYELDVCRAFKNNWKNIKKLRLTKDVLESKQLVRKFKRNKNLRTLCFLKNQAVSSKKMIHAFKNNRSSIKIIMGLHSTVIKYFPHITNFTVILYDDSSFETFVALPQIRSLNILTSLNPMAIDPEIKRMEEMRFWLHLNRLGGIKHVLFNANTWNKEIENFLMVFDSLVDLLKKLKSLDLKFNLEGSKYLTSHEFPFENLFSYVTKLEVYDAMIPAGHYLYDHLEKFSSLRSLLLENRKFEQISNYLKGANNSLNFSPLSRIETFERLRKMEISVVLDSASSFQQFVETFCLPKSLEFIGLTLQKINWASLLQISEEDKEIRNYKIFEENRSCDLFYSKWQGLDLLKYVVLRFELIESSENQPTYLFVTPLFKHFTDLSSIEYSNQIPSSQEKKEFLRLEQFLEALCHLKGSLRKLWIEDLRISVDAFADETERFLELKDFLIFGSIFGSSGLKNLIKLNCIKVQSSESGPEVALQEVMVENAAEFSNCMKVLAFENIELKISMNLKATELTPEELVTGIARLVTAKKMAISLILTNAPKLQEEDVKRLNELTQSTSIFKKIKISNCYRQVIYDFPTKSDF